MGLGATWAHGTIPPVKRIVTAYYAFDIETTDLRWDKGQVTTWAIFNDDLAIVQESRDEPWLIARLRETWASLPPGIVLTWNGAVFDGPFVSARSVHLGLGRWFDLVPNLQISPKYEPQPGFAQFGYDPVFPASRGVHGHTDVAYAMRAWAEEHGCHWSLKPVARAFGIDVIEVDREHMEKLSTSERAAYCLSDVAATYRLAQVTGLLPPQTVKVN